MSNTYKLPLTYGLSAAGLLVLMFMIFYLSGSNPLLELGLFEIFVLPIFLYFVLKDFRNNYNQGKLTYSKGMTIGLLTTITTAIVVGLFTYIFLEIIDATLLEEYIETSLENLESAKSKYLEDVDQESTLLAQQEIANSNAFIIALDGVIKKSIIGLMLTSIIAVVLKKQ